MTPVEPTTTDAIVITLTGADLLVLAPDWELLALQERTGIRFVRGRRKHTFLAPASSYVTLRRSLADLPVEVTFGDKPPLSFAPAPMLAPRDYQQEALNAWLSAGGRGVVELPTGAGKTYVAIMAIAEIGLRTIVVVPTLDLVDQWQRVLADLLPAPVSCIGVLAGGVNRPGDVTVATYQSALIHSAELGKYAMLIVDEVHHLPADSFRRIAQGSWATYRLGLSATVERADGRHEDLADLLGPVVYQQAPEPLRERGALASYREVRVRVQLTPEEAGQYKKAMETYRRYVRTLPVSARSEAHSWLVRRSASDARAREALLAHGETRRLMWNASAKIAAVEEILARHREERVILFSESNEMVDRRARDLLLPAVTHETPVEERKRIVGGLRSGLISKVVTGRVLNEGVDIPDAAVAVIVSGNSTRREYVQRLGRVLRPKAGEAILYEIVTDETGETRQSQSRRRAPSE